jgi:hypothetical protein
MCPCIEELIISQKKELRTAEVGSCRARNRESENAAQLWGR